MVVTDEHAALLAIASLEKLSAEQQEALQGINAVIHNGEPFVNIHELVSHYNVLYFRKLLLPRVEVLWSPRLTLCAGICELSKDPSTGKLTRIRLKLSTPLLQYRPRSDTINTLLHEAIHAYFFITTSWRHSRDDDGTGHGVGFQMLADAINYHGNYKVTIYHTFHDEIESYRTHVWQCDGECKIHPPYFGLVKRSMNRAPGKGDSWWARHEAECGGTYSKIQEPIPTKKQVAAMTAKERAGRQKNKLDNWVTAGANIDVGVECEISRQNSDIKPQCEILSREIVKRKAQTVVEDLLDRSSSTSSSQKRLRKEDGGDPLITEQETLVECPICTRSIAESNINEHLDTVHP